MTHPLYSYLYIIAIEFDDELCLNRRDIVLYVHIVTDIGPKHPIC